MKICRIAATLICLAITGVASAIGPEFTYQGELTESAAPADGDYDFEFRIFASPGGGVQIGPTVTVNNEPVENGIFTVALDFGTVFDSGQQAWLDIRVRDGASVGPYTVLSPRQSLTATPYALTANTVVPNAIGTNQINANQVQRRITGTCGAQNFATGVGVTGTLICGSALGAGYWQGGLNNSIHYGAGNVAIGNNTNPDEELVIGNNLGLSWVIPAITVGGATGGAVMVGDADYQVSMSTGSSSGFAIISSHSPAGFGEGEVSMRTGGLNIGEDIGSPAQYMLRVVHDNFGLNLQRATTDNNWELYTSLSGPGGANLNLYANTLFRGAFDTTTGAYSAVSDRRLKKDIVGLESVLARVLQLEPSRFKMKDSNPENTESIGLIAQDVQPLFPELVHHTKDDRTDALTLNYSGLGVVAIQAIREQQETILLLEGIIESLEDRMAALELR